MKHADKTAQTVFHPGQRAQASGLYEVVHRSHHRTPGRTVIVRGQVFPNCKQCDADVTYVLRQSAPYIFDDEDFEPPSRESK